MLVLETERKGYADIIVAKHRNGPTGQIVLKFERETTRFRDVTDEEEVPPLEFEPEELVLEEEDDDDEDRA